MSLIATVTLLIALVLGLSLLYLGFTVRSRKKRSVGMNYIYFETSAINYLLDNYDDEHIPSRELRVKI